MIKVKYEKNNFNENQQKILLDWKRKKYVQSMIVFALLFITTLIFISYVGISYLETLNLSNNDIKIVEVIFLICLLITYTFSIESKTYRKIIKWLFINIKPTTKILYKELKNEN
jgi:amino acid transporter